MEVCINGDENNVASCNQKTIIDKSVTGVTTAVLVKKKYKVMKTYLKLHNVLTNSHFNTNEAKFTILH